MAKISVSPSKYRLLDNRVYVKNCFLTLSAVLSIFFWILGTILVQRKTITQFCTFQDREIEVFEVKKYHFDLLSDGCMWIVAALTFITLLQVWDYYRFQTAIESYKTGIKSPILRSQFRWDYLLELLVCAVHPPPLFQSVYSHFIKIGIFMFLRFYVVLRLQRDLNPIYQERHSNREGAVLRSKGMSTRDIDWLFTLRLRFYDHPISMTVTMSVFFTIACGLSMYACEWSVVDHIDCPDFFGFRQAFWLTMVTATTVGYGDVFPISDLGRLTAIVTAASGIIITALVIAGITAGISLSAAELVTVNAIKYRQAVRQERHEAARVIQLFFQIVVGKWRGRSKALSETPDGASLAHRHKSIKLHVIKILRFSSNARLRIACLELRNSRRAKIMFRFEEESDLAKLGSDIAHLAATQEMILEKLSRLAGDGEIRRRLPTKIDLCVPDAIAGSALAESVEISKEDEEQV